MREKTVRSIGQIADESKTEKGVDKK